jgi:hypothetical protein
LIPPLCVAVDGGPAMDLDSEHRWWSALTWWTKFDNLNISALELLSAFKVQTLKCVQGRFRHCERVTSERIAVCSCSLCVSSSCAQGHNFIRRMLVTSRVLFCSVFLGWRGSIMNGTCWPGSTRLLAFGGNYLSSGEVGEL